MLGGKLPAFEMLYLYLMFELQYYSDLFAEKKTQNFTNPKTMEMTSHFILLFKTETAYCKCKTNFSLKNNNRIKFHKIISYDP